MPTLNIIIKIRHKWISPLSYATAWETDHPGWHKLTWIPAGWEDSAISKWGRAFVPRSPDTPTQQCRALLEKPGDHWEKVSGWFSLEPFAKTKDLVVDCVGSHHVWRTYCWYSNDCGCDPEFLPTQPGWGAREGSLLVWVFIPHSCTQAQNIHAGSQGVHIQWWNFIYCPTPRARHYAFHTCIWKRGLTTSWERERESN